MSAISLAEVAVLVTAFWVGSCFGLLGGATLGNALTLVRLALVGALSFVLSTFKLFATRVFILSVKSLAAVVSVTKSSIVSSSLLSKLFF